MPQIQLPVFPAGVTHITNELAFMREGDMVVYFNGSMPVFTHAIADTRSFRMITSQFYVNGVAKEADISRAFGVSAISVKRAVKLYRQEGAAGFYRNKQKGHKKPVLTEAVLKAAQELLNQAIAPRDVAAQLGVKYDTLRKAISSGRLQKLEKKFQLVS